MEGNAKRAIIGLLLFLTANIQLCVCNTEERMLGHMLPLGAHRKPDNVEERLDIPSAKEFMEKYVLPSKPVVFRGILKDSPMIHTWTDEYLIEKYPDLELRLEAKTEKEGYVPIGDVAMGRDTLKNFIKTYHQTNKYVVSELPTPAWDEILVPSFMACGPMKNRFVEIDLWMSGGNTSSLLHKDAFNTLNCLFNGTKDWKLFEYKYEKELYKAYEPGDPLGGFSRINPEAVDLTKYPKVAKVPWLFTTVNKGDCLFLPKSMYHQVKSYGTMNTAVAMLFSRFDRINQSRLKFDDCPSAFLPLHEIDVDWQYPGKGKMFMGHSELRQTRNMLLSLSGKANKNLYQRALQLVTLNDYNPMKPEEKARKLLNIIQNGKSNQRVTRERIKNLPRSALREAALLVEALIPSNTYEYEYFQISPADIANLLSILVKIGNGVVKRKIFISQYQDKLWGSERIANLFFDNLAGEGEDEVPKELIVKNFVMAAKKFDKTDGSEGRDDKEEEGDDDEVVEDDAYLGRNIDLTDEKDADMLTVLSKQIMQGNFSDKSRSYGSKATKEGDVEDDEAGSNGNKNEEDDNERNSKTRKAESSSNTWKRDEL